jgi:hypothetical protein
MASTAMASTAPKVSPAARWQALNERQRTDLREAFTLVQASESACSTRPPAGRRSHPGRAEWRWLRDGSLARLDEAPALALHLRQGRSLAGDEAPAPPGLPWSARPAAHATSPIAHRALLLEVQLTRWGRGVAGHGAGRGLHASVTLAP